SEEARQRIREARGSFDPKLFADNENKYYEETNYFEIFQGGVKVPTWWGIEVKGQYERANGQYFNNERTVPDNGLGSLGISVPLGAGLFIDKRRAELRKAQIFEQSNTAEQINQLNDLFFEGTKAYAEWTKLYYQREVFRRAVRLSTVRFEGLKQSFKYGDKAAIDTLEALIQLQTRQLDLQETDLKFRNQTLELSNFLWENEEPVQLIAAFRPEDLDSLLAPIPFTLNEFEERMDTWRETHPQLLQYQYKLASLDVERRLKQEKLKPKFRVNYNLLTSKGSFTSTETLALAEGSRKWGFNFSVPILLREGRGALGQTQVKIARTEYEFRLKQQELSNKWQYYFNQIQTLRQQIQLYQVTVDNYQRLTDAEIEKFRNGESSLFLINSRERKQIEAENKLISLKAKYFKTWIALYWVGGELASYFEA
ncbi:MAG: TolC family protein, partial [Bacteroidota bacterium]